METGTKKTSFLKSKSFWMNIIGAVAIALQCKLGFVCDPILQALGITAANSGLKMMADDEIKL